MRYPAISLRSCRRYVVPVLAFIGTVLLLSTAISLFLNGVIWYRSQTYSPAVEQRPDQHTYIGDDYPAYYPLDMPDVWLTPENTIHYQIFTDDAEREWSSIFPEGGGFLRLGPEGRLFGLALFHQLHCLARIRRAMNVRQSSEHVHHCFNYLRQAILCEANPTIEPVIPILGRRSVNAEIPRVCRDWTQVYALVEENFSERMERRESPGMESVVYV